MKRDGAATTEIGATETVSIFPGIGAVTPSVGCGADAWRVDGCGADAWVFL